MKVLITGIFGQDGYYLSELLFKKGYEIYGIPNFKSRNRNFSNNPNLTKSINIVELNLLSFNDTFNYFSHNHFDQIYHFASTVTPVDDALSFGEIYNNNVSISFNIINSLIRTSFDGKFFFASSSLIFGVNSKFSPQTEDTPCHPDSAYAISKFHIQNFLDVSRERFNLNLKTGIFYNHDSFLRNDNFVLKKIVKSAIQISRGIQNNFVMGNIEVSRDWIHTSDAVLAASLIMESNLNDNFIIGSGNPQKISSVIRYVFENFNLNYLDFIKFDPSYFRKNEPSGLIANTSKIKKLLNWSPSVPFHSILDEMIEYELRILNDN
jgi:GDPmannose 4,6-dehydratase